MIECEAPCTPPSKARAPEDGPPQPAKYTASANLQLKSIAGGKFKPNKLDDHRAQYNFTLPKDMRGCGTWEWRCFVPAPDMPSLNGAGRSDIYWVVNGSVGLKLRGGANSSRFEIKPLCGLNTDILGLECYTKYRLRDISFKAVHEAMLEAGLSAEPQVGSWEKGLYMVEIRKKRVKNPKKLQFPAANGETITVDDFQKLEVALLTPSSSGSIEVAGQTYRRGEVSRWRSYSCEGTLGRTKRNAPEVLAHVKSATNAKVLTMGYSNFVVWFSQEHKKRDYAQTSK